MSAEQIWIEQRCNESYPCHLDMPSLQQELQLLSLSEEGLFILYLTNYIYIIIQAIYSLKYSSLCSVLLCIATLVIEAVITGSIQIIELLASKLCLSILFYRNVH